MRFYVGDYTNLGGPGVCECELTRDGTLRFIQNADTKIEDPTYLILDANGKEDRNASRRVEVYLYASEAMINAATEGTLQ